MKVNTRRKSYRKLKCLPWRVGNRGSLLDRATRREVEAKPA